MSKFKYYFFSSAIIILELVIALVISTKISKYGVFGYGKSYGNNDLWKVVYLVWIVPSIAILRIILQKFNILRTMILLIQNSFLYFILVATRSNINIAYMEIYLIGLVVNLLLYLIDIQIFNFLDSFFEEIESE